MLLIIDRVEALFTPYAKMGRALAQRQAVIGGLLTVRPTKIYVPINTLCLGMRRRTS